MAIIAGAILATLTYGLGLVALLSPSEQGTGLVEMLVFILAPCIALGLCAYAADNRSVKTGLTVQAILFWGFGVWLIYQQVAPAA